MGVTIVANEFSEETRKKFQEEADNLMEKYNRVPYDIKAYLAEKYKIAVSMYFEGKETKLNCHPCR